jgi:hypothetical protein
MEAMSMLRGTDIPNAKEMKVLRGLCLGDIEEEAHFANVGRKTFDGLLNKGWIEHATDETYGTVGFRITPSGQAALKLGHEAGL